MTGMSGMRIVPSMHHACHPGRGMFVCLVWLLMRKLMGVSVIHVVLVLSGCDYLIDRLRRLRGRIPSASRHAGPSQGTRKRSSQTRLSRTSSLSARLVSGAEIFDEGCGRQDQDNDD
jgi:hypothetical protein